MKMVVQVCKGVFGEKEFSTDYSLHIYFEFL